MKWIEILVRRLLFSFAVATLFTYNFTNFSKIYDGLPTITVVIAVVLFALSWRLEKEFLHLFLKKEEGQDSSMWGDFERRNPRLAKTMWQSIVTIGALHLFYLALDLLHLIEVNGQRMQLFSIAFLITLIFRVVDGDTYRK